MKTIISKIKICFYTLVLMCPLLSIGDECLSVYCVGASAKTPAEGEKWGPSGYTLEVKQVLEDQGGVIAGISSQFYDFHYTPRVVFIKMPVQGLVDGSALPQMPYRCIGTFSYVNTVGAKTTIPAFEKLSESELEEIRQAKEEFQKQYNERKKAEREAKQKAEPMWEERVNEIRQTVAKKIEEIEAADQPAREEYAKGLLEKLKFGTSYHSVLIERECVDALKERGRAMEDVSIVDKDIRVAQLNEFSAQSRWLDMLNLICSMSKDRDGRGDVIPRLPMEGFQNRIKGLIGDSFAKARQDITRETGYDIGEEEEEDARQ